MKLITEFPILEAAPVVAEDLQGNHRQLAEALIDIEHRQLPAYSIGLTHLTPFQFYAFNEGWISGQNTVRSSFNTFIENHEFSSGSHNPPLEVYPVDLYAPGWNRLRDLGNGEFKETVIYMPPTPGILHGGACIDSELRCSTSLPKTTSNYPYPNRDLWWEFAVFANGLKVGQGPRLYAGRHSIYIPFMTFTGAELVELDIRVRVYFGQQQFKDATSRNSEPLALHSAQLWAFGTSH